MSEAKHSPGPWIAADHPANGRLPIVSQANGRSIGAVSWFGTLPDGFKSHEQECHANARLIAAAPELLEALTMVRDADEDCKLDGLATIPPAARAKIDAAITKAGAA